MGFMGSDTLNKDRIQGWIDKYDLKTFVETGLENGRSLSWLMKLEKIEKFISIDIDYRCLERAERLGLEQYDTDEYMALNDSVTLLHGSSVDMLPTAMDAAEGNILWWLDAHVPKVGGQWLNQDLAASQEDIRDMSVAFPLEEELEVLKASRDISKDVILVDDMRVYDQDSWHRIFTERGYGDTGSSDFVSFALEATHIVTTERADSHYLIALPRVPV